MVNYRTYLFFQAGAIMFEVKNTMNELIVANKQRIYHHDYAVAYIVDKTLLE